MANDKVEFDVIVNGEKAKQSLEAIQRDLDKLEKQDKKTTQSMSTNWIAVGAKITAFAYATKKAIDAQVLQAQSEIALGAAMKNNANLIEKNIDNWKNYANEIQKTTNIGDEVTLKQLAFLNTLGLTDDQMKNIIQTSADLSNAGFMPMESAVKNLAKTLSGMQGELGELFPQLKLLSKQSLESGEGINRVAKAVRGQSEAMTNSPVGRWNAIWNTAGDTMESAGKAALQLLDSLGALNGAKISFGWIGTQFEQLALTTQGASIKVRQYVAEMKGNTEEVESLYMELREIEKKKFKLQQPDISGFNIGELKEKRNEVVNEITNMTKDIARVSDKINTTINDTGTASSNDRQQLDKWIIRKEILKETLKEIEEAIKNHSITVSNIAESLPSLIDTTKTEKELEKFGNMVAEMMDELYSQGGLNPEDLLFAEDQIAEWATKVQDNINRGLSIDEAMRAAGANFDALADEMSKKQQIISSAIESMFKSLEDSLVNLVMTGKMDFKSLASSIISDIVRMEIQLMIFEARKAMAGAGFSLFSPFHTGGEVKHTGGVIGTVPTYHSGMLPDERMAKLQVGEAVVNRAGVANNRAAIAAMNAGYKVGGGGGGNTTTATINFNVQAIDSASFDSYLMNNKNTIEGIINRSIMSNGSVRKTIKQSR